MSLEDRRHDFPQKAHLRDQRFSMRRWYLRLRLRWISHDIDKLERELAGEFATVDVAPLNEQLQALIARRAAMLERLADGS